MHPFRTHKRLFLPLVAAILATGCSGIEKAKPTPRTAKVDESFKIDVPEVMRGTVASETIVLGYESPTSNDYRPVVVSGYGLVVGLNGTGSRDIPPPVRAYMLAQAQKYGVGSERYGGLTPEQLIDSPDTAVVVVQAIVPQAAVKRTKFDVRVVTDPQTGTTSLEGGRLWTTELRPGLPTVGGAQAAALAVASGPIFINPFAEPGAIGRDTVVRTAGRILNGGAVLKDMPLKLRLSNPSHARAAILQSAINTRFPQEQGQRDLTARGESEAVLKITVPPSFKERTDEFIDLLRHTTIAQANPEVVAMSIKRVLLANPMVANAAALRWQALGNRVLPIIKDLYDYTEERPRLAALQAGAKLNDALAVPHLLTMAQSGSADVRLDAIRLLANMQTNPLIDQSLQRLLDDSDVEVRLEAYEALVERGEEFVQRYSVDKKFVLDVVESNRPMVYITQIGQPRIVVFGEKLEIERPTTMTAWSNRFIIKGDLEDDMVEVYFRQPDAEKGAILRTEPNLVRFIQFLGHTTTIEKPAPGLGLSYGETVNILYQVWKQQYVKADFKAEQDRILAAINRVREETDVPERPEFASVMEEGDATPRTDFGPTSDLGRLNRNAPPMPTGGFEPVAPAPSPPPGRDN